MVIQNVASQIQNGNSSIMGLMIESHLKGGRQNIPVNLDDLEYGKSVTDGCLDWEATVETLRTFAKTVKAHLQNR